MKAGYYMQDDYGNVTLVNVSGIYDEQPLFIDKLKKGSAGVIDAVSMTGTNGYCDDMAKENFSEMMKEYPTFRNGSCRMALKVFILLMEAITIISHFYG